VYDDVCSSFENLGFELLRGVIIVGVGEEGQLHHRVN
jgi:hypothetical protein